MLKQEFETIAGETVTPAQYQMIEGIYRDFPEISDTKGKQQIVAMYKSRGINGMYKLWKELNPGKYAIAYFDQDVTDNYGVDFDGICRNITPKKIGVIFDELEDYLLKKYPAYKECIDYLSICLPENLRDTSPLPAYHRIVCFFVRGSSEGWYLHIELLHNDKHTLLFLAKSFDRDIMPVLVDEINQYFGH